MFAASSRDSRGAARQRILPTDDTPSLRQPLRDFSPPRLADRTPPSEFSDLRVLIVHDWIIAWGGAERTVEQMLTLFPRARLVVGVLDQRKRDFNSTTRLAEETWLGRMPLARHHHRWFLPLYPAAFASVNTEGYDLILSSCSAFSKSVRIEGGVPHLCYCYTPPRYLWDLQAEYGSRRSPAGLALSMAGPLLRAVDRNSTKGVTRFVAISHHIKDRIARAYGRDASVVYPPVRPKPASAAGVPRSAAYLSLGRLVPYKRVDLAILAANAVGARLIVAGDGPERARLEAIAGPSVSFLGEVSEEQAGNLMESCRAMIFCAEEDFGIAPLEANAHGMPVIAFGRGAVRETMVEHRTSLFFEQLSTASVGDAMQRLEHMEWSDAALRANAQRFLPERFRQELASEARALL